VAVEWYRLAVLDELGFSLYEKKALAAINVLGVADAASLCREGEIPTSKIYGAMERLQELGAVEIQPTRPKLYSARSPDVVVECLIAVARQRADAFASRSGELRDVLSGLPRRLAGRETFADLALGSESHVKRHLTRLADAKTRILSYLEEGDIEAIMNAAEGGFDVLRRIARNVERRKIDHRMIFGFRYQSAPRLLEFLKDQRNHLEKVTGVRYSGELGHPFHLIDDDAVILALDHPFISEGRFASLLVRDEGLVEKLASGFEELWSKAMKDLREIRFQPRG